MGTQYEFPGGTYAYTTTTDMVYQFSKPVSIQSFWLRLHQAPQAYKEVEFGTKLVQIYNGQMLVAQSVVYLWSDQWYLVTPKPNAQVIGDKIVIQMGTDFDSLVI